MEKDIYIPSPFNEGDPEDAKRVFDEFCILYHPILGDVESYLETIMDRMGPSYAQAYQPWYVALQDLLQGVYLTVKKIPLPDTQSFLDAIKLFSFDSAIRFLYDLCISCRIQLPRDWATQFQKNIHRLLTAAAILYNQQQQVLSR